MASFKNVLFSTIRLLVLVSIVSATSVVASESEWELKKTDNGISVYSRDVADSAINAIRAQANFDVPPAVVEAILLEYGTRTKWNSMCIKAETVAQADPDQTLVYFHYDMPWPVKDRDLVMQFKHESSDSGVKITATAIESDVAPVKKVVRVIKAWEEWTVRRLENGSSEVTMTVFMDPNGPIPAWLINTMSVSEPLQAMSILRDMSLARLQE